MFKHTAKHFALSMIMPHSSLFATSPFVHSFSLPVFVLVIIYKGNIMFLMHCFIAISPQIFAFLPNDYLHNYTGCVIIKCHKCLWLMNMLMMNHPVCTDNKE